jgi:signal transduction histidine kinase
MLQVMSRRWVSYVVAIAVTAAALGLKLLLVPLVTADTPFLLFFAAVLVAAAFGGMGPGLLATALAAMLNNYFFMRPFGRLTLDSTDQQIRLALFVGESIFICVICARLRAAHQRVQRASTEARVLERRILEISDEEQRRIGHDLHDGLGQQLTGIGLMTRHLEQRLTAANSPDSAIATKVSELAKDAVAWTHDLCRTLSPPALGAGLDEALRELAANAESIFSIDCNFTPEGESSQVDVAASVHLYRIAQEAISNAVRHGKARNVKLLLEGLPSGLTMQIIDDGSGIVPESAPADGMGLRIMRYRARMIGATIEVKHRDAGGTAVICRYRSNGDLKRENHGNT